MTAEWVEIEGVALKGAIECIDIDPLLSEMTRGNNRTLPGQTGTRPYAPELDELDVTIRWEITGVTDPDGDPTDNFRIGLNENLEFYRALLRDDADPDTGTKEWTLKRVDGDIVADVQVWSWDVVRKSPSERTVLTRIVVPAGRFQVSGS